MDIRILLIEDDPVDRMAFERLVREARLPYDYRAAGSIKAARDLLQSHSFDLIVLDYFLGDGTAFDILALDTGIPAIITTGAGDEEVAVRSMKQGAYDYLIKDASGDYLRALPLVVTAVMRQKRAEDQVVEANRRKDQFLALLSHELRNSLAPLRNAAELIQHHPGGDPVIRHARDVFERQVGHLTRLVEDLLDLSRVNSGKIILRREVAHLQNILERVVEDCRVFVESRQQRLEVDLPADPLYLTADPFRISQVVANLLNNASKYTPKGGTLELSLVCEEKQAVIRVKDDGVGMTEPVLNQIFEMFFQADQSLTQSQGGLGLGLTLARSLVELHEGSIEAWSAGPGKGSVFTVRLPILEALQKEQRRQDGARRSEPEPIDRQPLRLLVVDDNVDSAETLAMLLRLEGHEVLTTHDGKSALELVKCHALEAALIDIAIPGIDGYEVARTIRGALKQPDILLIAMTGFCQEDDRRRSLEAGFDHHLVKPVDPDFLQTLLPLSAKDDPSAA